MDGDIHVCLIEDDRGDYLLTRRMLADAGGAYDLHWISGYEEGLRAVLSGDWDVYLLDYRLGERNGLELLEEAVIHQCLRPIILLTGQGGEEVDRQAMASGASDYLVKGTIDGPALARSIRYAIERKRSELYLRHAHETLEQRVRERTRELLRANLDLQREIEERSRMEEALRQSDQAKEAFLAVLGHELRNPLGAISNALEVIRQRGPERRGAVARSRATLERQVVHMTHLVNDLLDMSRVNRGTVSLQRERLDLRSCVEQAVDTMRQTMDDRGPEVSVRLSEEPLWVDADPTRIEQVVGNLLNNAAKFTDTGGRIAVHAYLDGEDAVVRVADSGIGLGPEMLHRVFEPFTQMPGGANRSRGGLGIGLSLVRSFVEMHGGGVTAESDGPGMGSVFTVRLPLLQASPSPPPDGQSAHDERRGMHRLRILIVDDNHDAAETLSDILETWGHSVVVAHDGREALGSASSEVFDVAVMDIGMPVMDGYQVAGCLRESAHLNGITLIALTGLSLIHI